MKAKAIIILLLISISFTNWNCSLVGDVLDGDDNPAQYAISSDRYNVVPFETVTLTINEYYFSEDSYYGEIYDKEVLLIKISDTQLTFMMPLVPEGERILEFILEDVKHDLTFTILTLEEIDNPDEIITTYQNNIVEAFNELKVLNQQQNTGIEPENLQVIDQLLEDFNQGFSNATEDEKQELAQIMKANPELFDFKLYDYSQFNDSMQTSKDYISWDRQLSRDAALYAGVVIAGVLTVNTFVASIKIFNPWVFGISAAALVVEYTAIKYLHNKILTTAYKPFQFDIDGELRTDIIEFENETEYILGIDATYRTLFKDDQQSSGVIIELVVNIDKVAGAWNTVKGYISGTTGTYTNISDKISYVANSNRSSVDPQFISIDKMPNSGVNLVGFNNSNNVRVIFQTSSDEDQNFTFDIVYKSPDFSEERITINAKVLVPVFDLTGNWMISYYTADLTTGIEYLHQQEKFTCNTSGYAPSSQVRYPNNPPPNNGWQTGGEVNLNYNNGRITISESAGFYVQVNDVDDTVFYSYNWDTNYNIGDYYWKIKLEK